MNNFQQPYFQQSRRSLTMFLVLPGLTIASFNLLAPFSIFKPIMITSTLVATTGSLVWCLSSELDKIAHSRKDGLGEVVRYRFQQLSSFDTMQMNYRR